MSFLSFEDKAVFLSSLCSKRENTVSTSSVFSRVPLSSSASLYSLEVFSSITTSGVITIPLMHTPDGVKYLAVVKRKPEPSGKGITDCTEPDRKSTRLNSSHQI